MLQKPPVSPYGVSHSWRDVEAQRGSSISTVLSRFPQGVWIRTVNGKTHLTQVKTMGRNRAVGYLSSHFLGNQSLAMSFVVNGVIFYLLMVAAILGFAFTLGHFGILTDIGVPVGIVLLCGLAWSLTGNVLAAVKALKNPSSSRLKKTFALCILGAVILAVVYIVRDALHIRSLYG
jgi:hypothetical protein